MVDDDLSITAVKEKWVKNKMMSIIVPVYNNEKYLSKCIESVISQNTTLEYELIIVDDGSTDCSLEICRSYKKKSSRIRIITQDNAGVSMARNAGIEMASGDYVMFLDSDDWLEKGALQIIEQEVKESRPDILVYGIKFLQGEKVTYISELERMCSLSKEESISLILEIYRRGAIASSVNKVYRKSLLGAKPFEPNIKYGEDLRFNLRIFLQATRLSVIPNALYVYNKHDNSLTTTLDSRQIQEMLQLHNKSYVFFEKLGADREVSDRLLQAHYYEYLYPYHIARILDDKKLAYAEKCRWIDEILDTKYISYLTGKSGIFSRLLSRKDYRKLIWYRRILKIMKR